MFQALSLKPTLFRKKILWDWDYSSELNLCYPLVKINTTMRVLTVMILGVTLLTAGCSLHDRISSTLVGRWDIVTY
jgi:hypothetical protein